jgi:hypothetical protein
MGAMLFLIANGGGAWSADNSRKAEVLEKKEEPRPRFPE